ncbi:MAG: TetR/AcrR family transcriptional regulator [Candidatus Sericytochromatia bacterium]
MEIKNIYDTKEKIIYSAIQLLLEGGYESFTSKKLIEKAGISKGALYHYFKSLDEIPLEAIKRLKKSKMYLPPFKAKDYDKLDNFFYDYFEYTVNQASNPDVLCINLYYTQKSISNDEYRLHKNELTNDLFSFYNNSIQRFYKKQIPQEKLQALSSIILFFIEGIIGHSFMFADKNKFIDTYLIIINTIKNELKDYE